MNKQKVYCRRYRIVIDGYWATGWVGLEEAWQFYKISKALNIRQIYLALVHVSGYILSYDGIVNTKDVYMDLNKIKDEGLITLQSAKDD